MNFNKPYSATSPSDFWKRWHISLSSWLRDYLYIPLGGNKKSKNRTYLNLMTVMFLGGLWHGASWNFVIWGVLHGVYLAIHKLVSDRFPRVANNSFFKSRIGKITSIIIMQYLVFLAWIPFRVSDVDHLLYSIQKYVLFDFQISEIMSLNSLHKISIELMVIFLVLNYVSYKKYNLHEIIYRLKTSYWILFLTTVMVLIVFFFDGNPEDFIYFRF